MYDCECVQVKTDILLHYEKSQKLAKNAILSWTKEFPSSNNALRALSHLRIQTAISSYFWRTLSSNLTCSTLFPQGHLQVIKLLIQQFKLCQVDEDEDVQGA